MNAGKPSYLRTSCGKYVFVESKGSGSTPQIVARSVQLNKTNSSKVTVTVNEHTGGDNVKCMAFCFELNKKKYFPVVNGDKLGFEETLPSDKKFWFQWGEKTGKWRTVQSVAEPNMFLVLESETSNVIISSQRVQHFRIFFQVKATSTVTTPNNIPMSMSTRHNDDSTRRMVWRILKSPTMETSVKGNEIKMIQNERPVHPNSRYRNDMSIQSNDKSTCQMVVQNFKISHNGNPREEENRPEMVQDSRPMYLKTRLRQYMWDGSKDGSTSQMVVEKIKISDDRNPRRGNKRIQRVYCSKETTE